MQLAAFNNNNVRARPRRDARQRGPARSTWSTRLEQQHDLAEHDRRHPRAWRSRPSATTRRSSLSYKLKRMLRFKARAGARTDPYVTRRPGAAAARARCSAESDLLVVGAPRTGVPRPRDRRAGRRHLEPARQRGARVMTAHRGVDRRRSPPTTRATAIVRVPRPHLRGGHARRARCSSSSTRRRHDRRRRSTEYAERRAAACAPWSTPTAAARRNAIRFGIDHAPRRRSSWSRWPTAATTRGRSTPLARLVERGVVVAAASRYIAAAASRSAARCSRACCRGRPAARSASFARVGTRRRHELASRPTRPEFVREVGIDSRSGFEIGLELAAKARRLRLPVAELPTIWLDRHARRVELQARELDAQVPALVPLRVRAAAHGRAGATQRQRRPLETTPESET